MIVRILVVTFVFLAYVGSYVLPWYFFPWEEGAELDWIRFFMIAFLMGNVSAILTLPNPCLWVAAVCFVCKKNAAAVAFAAITVLTSTIYLSKLPWPPTQLKLNEGIAIGLGHAGFELRIGFLVWLTAQLGLLAVCIAAFCRERIQKRDPP